jgi:peptide deformylase
LAVKAILTLGHPMLRKAAEDVELKRVKKRNFRNLITDMFDTMSKNGGVGLAGPQVGVSLRFFIKGFEEQKRYPDIETIEKEVIINPKIKFLTQDNTEFWEGCLSIPNMRGLVKRPNKIEVEYYNEELKKQKKILQGFEAIVFQHEYDHLDGNLYIDKLVSTRQFGYNEHLDLENE